jgi:hypothetical protein
VSIVRDEFCSFGAVSGHGRPHPCNMLTPFETTIKR